MTEVVIVQRVGSHVNGPGRSDGLCLDVPLDGVHGVIMVTVHIIMVMVTRGAPTARLGR